ncbi:hypothetical protein EDB92DRAFT_1944540 [Lactarius akahatsu]|uniref:Uncharacterized protein n=1 Tax=Lactarius akahatsu TaxID=416441 RepID=A0AAD4Q8Y7_9AGAM|nr:hypothetical protein EDB92DRAFT_1944540 [Lactarius akahatsu]
MQPPKSSLHGLRRSHRLPPFTLLLSPLSSFPYLHLAASPSATLSSSSYDRSPCHISVPTSARLPCCLLPATPRHPATALTAFTTPLPLAAALGLLLAFLPPRVAPPSSPSPPSRSARSPLLAAALAALSSLTLALALALALTTISLVSSLLFAATTTPTLP